MCRRQIIAQRCMVGLAGTLQGGVVTRGGSTTDGRREEGGEVRPAECGGRSAATGMLGKRREQREEESQWAWMRLKVEG